MIIPIIIKRKNHLVDMKIFISKILFHFSAEQPGSRFLVASYYESRHFVGVNILIGIYCIYMYFFDAFGVILLFFSV